MRWWPRATLVGLLALASCSRCGSEKPTAPGSGVERVLPVTAAALVVVPSVQGLGARVAILQNLKVAGFVAQLQNFETASSFADALVAQLGVDFRKPEALTDVGIEPSASAGAAVFVDGTGFLALPIKDEGRLKALVATIARSRAGATTEEDKVEGAFTVHRYAVPGGPVRFGYVVAHGHALIASDQAVDHLATWAALDERYALSKDPALASSLQRLPAQRDLVLYLPPGSPALLQTPLDRVAIVGSLAADALTFTADAVWNDQATLALFEAKPGARLLGLLPADAFVVGRFGGDPRALGRFARLLVGPYLQRAFDAGGLDFDAEVLGNLQPGAVVGLSLAPTAKMGQGMPAIDLRRTNPFTYVHLSGAATAVDGARAQATLEKLSALAPKFGATIESKARAGHPVFVTTYSQGEGVHFARTDDGRVVFGSPIGRLDALLAAAPDAAGPLGDAALAAAASQHGASLVVDLRRLAESVKALPSEAWGIGGFAIKATTVRWLDATDDLEAITLVADSKQGAVQAQLQLRLTKAAAKASAAP